MPKGMSQLTPQDRVLQFALGASVAEIDSLMSTLRVIKSHKSGLGKKIAAGKAKNAAASPASEAAGGTGETGGAVEPKKRAKRSDAGKKKGQRTGVDEVTQDVTQAPQPASTTTTSTHLDADEQQIARDMLAQEAAAQEG